MLLFDTEYRRKVRDTDIVTLEYKQTARPTFSACQVGLTHALLKGVISSDLEWSWVT